jgi:hypothetical protein
MPRPLPRRATPCMKYLVKVIAPAALLAAPLTLGGCARILYALGAGAGYAATHSSSPPPPPPAKDSATARRPMVTAQFVSEVSTGGTTKQCVYSFAGNTHVTTVSITERCPRTIQVPAW